MINCHKTEMTEVQKQLSDSQNERFKIEKKIEIIKTENENKIKKMKNDNQILVDALRLEFGKRNNLNQDKISKLQIELQTSREKTKTISKRLDSLNNEKEEIEKSTFEIIIKQISLCNPHINIKSISNLNEALSVLRTCIKKSAETENSIYNDLSKKDEELRKIQKNMSQWKQSTAKRLAKKFEDELKRISEKNSTQLNLGDVESGFESAK